VQTALIEEEATQCGFCTPGFVMSLFALYRQGVQPDRAGLADALAGNLCRCTGYGPIVTAGLRALGARPADRIAAREAAVAEKLADWRGGGESLAYRAAGRRYDAPRSRDELAALLARDPATTMVAGLTDVGIWITKQHQRLEQVVYLGEVAELAEIRQDDGVLEIGAAVTYSDALPVLAGHWPDLGELLRRLGSLQIRNVATIGGNIANGSPVGDMPPPLIALDARLVLGNEAGRREIALEAFFLDYGRQDLRPGEFVEAVRLPLPTAGDRFRCYKLTKRFDQDISSVCGAFYLHVDDSGTVDAARFAYGGMAGIPKRAPAAEAAVLGRRWDEAAVRGAMTSLDGDFTPISDHRASSAYRILAARNLLYKFYLESAGATVPARLPGLGGAADG
jgi:xanthine dehydrogenase small subunit